MRLCSGLSSRIGSETAARDIKNLPNLSVSALACPRDSQDTSSRRSNIRRLHRPRRLQEPHHEDTKTPRRKRTK